MVTRLPGKGPSEKEWMASVVLAARTLGWRVYHTHDSRRSVDGFPDLEMVRAADGRHLYAELKVPPNATTPAQDAWLADLRAVGREVHVWYPADWDDVQIILAR